MIDFIQLLLTAILLALLVLRLRHQVDLGAREQARMLHARALLAEQRAGSPNRIEMRYVRVSDGRYQWQAWDADAALRAAAYADGEDPDGELGALAPYSLGWADTLESAHAAAQDYLSCLAADGYVMALAKELP